MSAMRFNRSRNIILYNSSERNRGDIMKVYNKYQTARIVGARALQISRGAPIMVETTLSNPIDIAILELKRGLCPLDIKD